MLDSLLYSLLQMVDVWLPLQVYQKDFDAGSFFTDTDSLSYETKSENVYEEFFKRKYVLDFSTYPKNAKSFDETNKKVIGKMKDESEGKTNYEFVGLKSTMYYIEYIDDKGYNTAKAVSIATEFNELKDTLCNKKKYLDINEKNSK